MKVIYKSEPVTVVRMNLIKSEYLNKPIINQVKIKYKDGTTDYVDSREIIWEPDADIENR
jgi:hypothetical protein